MFNIKEAIAPRPIATQHQEELGPIHSTEHQPNTSI